MRPFLLRIAAEKRWWLLPIAGLLLLNVATYVLVVRPMAEASAGAGARATAAAEARRTAERAFAGVEARQRAQQQARADLQTFLATSSRVRWPTRDA